VMYNHLEMSGTGPERAGESLLVEEQENHVCVISG
jgi:hypothetical protein